MIIKQARFLRELITFRGKATTWNRTAESGNVVTFHFCQWSLHPLRTCCRMVTGVACAPQCLAKLAIQKLVSSCDDLNDGVTGLIQGVW